MTKRPSWMRDCAWRSRAATPWTRPALPLSTLLTSTALFRQDGSSRCPKQRFRGFGRTCWSSTVGGAHYTDILSLIKRRPNLHLSCVTYTFIPGNTQVSIGLQVEIKDGYPIIVAVKSVSPLVGRVFCGDCILTLNDMGSNTFSPKETCLGRLGDWLDGQRNDH